MEGQSHVALVSKYLVFCFVLFGRLFFETGCQHAAVAGLELCINQADLKL